jgi:hypothetical protein
MSLQVGIEKRLVYYPGGFGKKLYELEGIFVCRMKVHETSFNQSMIQE